MLGHVDRLTRNLISGWAANPSRPNQVVAVRLTIDGVRTRIEAGEARDDLTGLFPGATGRYGFSLSGHPLPISPFTEAAVELVFAANGETLPGGKATLPPLGSPHADAAQLPRTPIVLTSTGRAGSSLFMRRLAQHPDVLVARGHPHELMLLSYYALAFNTLTANADRARSTDPDTMLASAHRFHVGFNPFNDLEDAGEPMLRAFWNMTAPDILRGSFISLIDAYYTALAQTARKPRARFFAEKIGTSAMVRQAAGFLFGAVREIVLVRDPRDVVCSSKHFWKRGFADSVRSLRGQLAGMARPRTEPGLTQHVVRYEDLLTRPDDTMRAVCGFLGIAAAASAPEHEAERSIFEAHGTSASPEATVGRWRRELSTEEAAIANREFAPFLLAYGYEGG